MRIDETKRSHIDEGPLDLLTKSGRAQRRSFKQGRKTVKLTAQNLQNQFAEYLGVLGKRNIKQATTQDVINFLDQKNVDTSDINPSEPMDPKRLTNIFTVKSREAIQGKGAKKPTASPAQGQSSPSSTPAAKPSSAYVQTKDAALKLNAKEKRRLIQQLQKSIKPSNKPTVGNP